VNLNKEQLEAIAAGEGAWNVMATAGAGKTTCLTKRIERLLKEGVSPNEILAVTFTVFSAENMQKKLGWKTDKRERGGIRNFHSFGLNVVKQESRYLPYGLSLEALSPTFSRGWRKAVVRAT